MADIDGVSTCAMIEGLIAGQPIERLTELAKGVMRHKREVLEHVQAHNCYLEAELAKLDAYLIEAMEPYREYWQLLQTIPGIDQISAAMILIEIGDDLSAFAHAKHLASWAALCLGNHESAGKRKPDKTPKGNHAIRYLLCEAANAARRTKSALHEKYQSLVGRRGHKKAIIALAH